MKLLGKFRLASKRGFILPFTILLILGVSSIAIGTIYNSHMSKTTALNYKNKITTFHASDGLMTLIAQEMLNGNQKKYMDTTRYGKIYGKVYTGITGNAVSTLKTAIANNGTNYTDSANYLGSNWDFDNYGVKWTGYLLPPVSGSYTFYVRSDDNSRFYLSTDSVVANLRPTAICSLNSWTDKWPTSGSGVSSPIPLQAGTRYYFEYFHKEGGGGDYGQVGWDGPEYLNERPISGKYLSTYNSDPPYTGVDTVGGLPVTFRVSPTGVDAYGIFTQSVKTKSGAPTDTTYRTPLSQNLSVKGTAIAPDDTVWTKVLIWDYRANGTNPDFEPAGYTNGVQQGMIENKLTISPNTDTNWAGFFGLGTLKKPKRKAGNTIQNRSCNLDKWFKPWTASLLITDYSYTDCRTKTVAINYSLENKAVRDSIPFVLDVSQGPNTYVFSRVGNYPDPGDPTEDYFFWLDGKSQAFTTAQDPYKTGKSPPGGLHNFAFAMEMHATFVHQSGLKFQFNGDDDVWLFINDSLVMDLGGLHSATTGEVNLDDIKNLTFGSIYNLDFFYCERHTDESTCRIITNIMATRTTGAPIARWKRDYGSLD